MLQCNLLFLFFFFLSTSVFIHQIMQSSSSSSSSTIRADVWFQNITGYSEPEWRRLPDKHIEQAEDGSLLVVNQKNGKKFKAGTFRVCTLQELVGEVESLVPREDSTEPPRERGQVLFEIITRADRESIRFVDVAYQQAERDNRNALFQVASNFNGVEAISERSAPDNPSFTENYIYDMTQGPAASISAGAAAITRVHAAFFDPSKPASQWEQTSHKQVNFLQNLKEHFPVQNGYVCLTGSEPPFPSRGGREWDDLLLKVAVGYHHNVQVTTGHRSGSILQVVNDPDQLIDQVFCAAMNVGQGTSGARNARQLNSVDKCKFILQADYEGTYLGAIKHRRSHLYLTLLGGGVFGNERDWIYEAIIEAHYKWAAHPASTLKKVSLVLFSDRDFDESLLRGLKAKGIPFEHVVYQNGRRAVVAQKNNY